MTDPPRRRMVRPPTGGTEEGRGKPARLKTAKMRTPSSQAWLSRQINDPWAAKARAHGYRSRAAYKLTDIADRFGLLKPGQRVIDLGAARHEVGGDAGTKESPAAALSAASAASAAPRETPVSL